VRPTPVKIQAAAQTAVRGREFVDREWVGARLRPFDKLRDRWWGSGIVELRPFDKLRDR
jgi:hypothetical protein